MSGPTIPSCSAPRLGVGPIITLLRQRLAQTPSLLGWIERLAVVAEHDVPVLLTGETGTGKTSLARIIHDCSPRAAEPFVTIACGALPPQLVESEFFGHVRGAFTGAERERRGKVAAAGRGTLLLDEIDTLSLEQQAKLLRILDSGEYEPVGGNDTLHRACRIMVASNADLEELAQQGKFRSDLYYRLHVMPFHLPPLRARTQDIAPLVQGLAARFIFGPPPISPAALAVLESYSWPGDIRELDNALQQAMILSRGEIVLPEHLPDLFLHGLRLSKPAATTEGHSLRSEREAAERILMCRVLADYGHNRTRAAQHMGISRTTLHKKMKKYGLAQV